MRSSLLVLLSTFVSTSFAKWTFEAEDYFEQYSNSSVITTEAAKFGLKSAYSWESLLSDLNQLNAKSTDTQYKLIFWARHGEAYHNVVKDDVGDDAWKTVGTQDTYNGITLFDDDLTDTGLTQVQNVGKAWTEAISSGAPSPESYYISPLQRTLHTFKLTFGDAQAGEIVEDLRERYGKYTPYERHNKTWISDNFPGLTFEDGFTEDDELWTTDREDKSNVQDRVNDFLKTLYKDDTNTVISITTHSGTVEQLLKLIDHPAYDLDPGQLLPTVIKGVKP